MVYRKAEAAPLHLASQWVERFKLIDVGLRRGRQDPARPDRGLRQHRLAEVFYRNISGETIEAVEAERSAEDDDEAEDEDDPATRKDEEAEAASGLRPWAGLPRLLLQHAGPPRRTVRIDSKLLDQAESDDPNVKNREAAEELRRIVATVGRVGEPGSRSGASSRWRC